MSIENVWFSEGAVPRLIRGALWPASLVFETVVRGRNALYDRGVFRTIQPPVPTISVGNLSVGGTGKTPVAAYLVQRLAAAGRHPALVMRGYGDDEPAVHRLLNPGIPVITRADRVAGIAEAVTLGADVVVLDDAFQHRRAGRAIDIVLVSSERWRRDEQVLPAGSLREPMSSLRRASLIIVTRKSASDARLQDVMCDVAAAAPNVPMASVDLRLDRLVAVHDDAISVPVTDVRDERVLAVAGVGDPGPFFAQVRGAGAVVTPVAFPDHHQYTRSDVTRLAALASGHKYIVTTLKDAVKLTRVWPPKGAPLWYVSQSLVVGANPALIDTALMSWCSLDTSTPSYGYRSSPPHPQNRPAGQGPFPQ